MTEPWKGNGGGVEKGAGLDRYRVVQNMVREPWKSQEVEVGVGAGLDKYRVV